MPGPVALDCPKCGAKLTPAPGATTVRCEYCGTTSEVDPSGAALRSIQVRRVPHRGARVAALVISVVVILIAVVVGYFVVGPSPSMRGAQAHIVHATEAAAHGIPPGSPMVQWDDLARPALVDGVAGHTVLLALIRKLKGSAIHLVATAYDAKTLQPMWQSPVLGTWDDYQVIHARAAGRRAVLSDARGRIVVDDLATGKTLLTQFLPDRAKELCVPDPAKPVAWALTADGTGHEIDLSTGKLTDAKRPAACPAGCEGMPAFAEAGAARCRHLALAPKDVGMKASDVVLAGAAVVAFGDRAKGTEVPMAVGLDPKTHEVLWKRTVPAKDPYAAAEDDPIAIATGGDGAVYGILDMKEGPPKVIALDAATGHTLWAVPVRGAHGRMVEGTLDYHDGRVYLGHDVELDVLDAKTGKLVGTLGEAM